MARWPSSPGGTALSFTPTLNFNGAATISYTISDGQGGTASATVFMTVTPVNDAPVAVNDGSLGSPFATVAEDSGASAAIPVLGNDSDLDSDPLTITAASSSNGTVAIVPGGTALSFTPALNFNGATTISYTILDGQGGTASATVFVRVTPVNDAPVAIVGTAMLNEDSSVNITLSGSDIDAGDTLSFLLASGPSHGSVTIVNSVATYTPNANFHGPDSFTFKANDGMVVSLEAAMVSITVAPVNDPPVADDQLASVDEDGSVQIPLTGSDDAGESLTFAVFGGPSHGTMKLNGPVITYTPDPDYNGQDAIYFIAFTLNGGMQFSEPATVSITVNPVNDPPVALAQAVSVNEDGTVDITLTANDPDLSDTLSFAVGTPSHGSVSLDGAVATYSPNGNYNGLDGFTFTVSDGTVTSAPAPISITVDPVNDAPVVVNDGSLGSPFVTVAEDSDTSAPILVLANDSDVDADPLTISAASSPDGTVTIVSEGAALSFAPALNFNGATTISYTISDGQGGTASATAFVTVTPVNDAPVAIAGAASVNEDGTVDITLTANDPDLSDTLSFAVGTPSNGSVSLDGAVATYTPTGDFNGLDSFTFTVSDDTVTSDPAAISITVVPVNDAPVAVNDGGLGSPFVTVAEDSGASAAILAQANDSDVDADPLTITAASSPDGTVAIISSGTALSFTPALNFNGATTISYTISDGQGGTASATAFVTVTPVNDAPVVIAGAASVNEDGTVDITLTANDPDLSDTLSFAVGTPSNGSVSLDGAVATYAPTGDYNGPDGFTFTVSDGTATSDPAAISITVVPVNDAPVAVNDGSLGSPFVTVAEDSGASAAILAQANDSDVDSDPLTITAATSPNGTVAIISSGTALSFTPVLNFNGATTISYTISDGQGGTASATAFVTVTPVNDAPVAVNDGSLGSPFATVAEDSGASAAIPVLGNDSDLDSDPLTITAASSSNGTVAIVPGGTALSFTPTLNFNGAATISYTISDGQGGTASATVFMTVTPVNDAPVAVNDGSAGSSFATVAEDSGATAAIPVLANDSDLDSDPLTITAASSSNGTVAIVPGGTALSFTPALNFNGVATISYTISDGQGGTASATVFVRVTPVDDAPMANTQSVTVNEDGSVVITLTGSDIDGDPLFYTTATSSEHGNLVQSGATLTYTPSANYHGPDSFTFFVFNLPTGAPVFSPAATVSITVTPINDAPVAVNDGSSESPALTVDANSGSSAPIPVLANDSDIDLDSLTVTAASSANGTVTINGNGALVFSPASNFSGATTIGYTISDGNATANATVFVMVSPSAGLTGWLAGFGLAATAGEDSDGDSISNAVEYVIGGDPANKQDLALLPTVNMATPGYLTFIYRRTDLAKADSSTTITVEWGTNLTNSWTAADGTHGEVIQVEEVDGEDYDLVKVRVPRSLAPNGKLFARLGVMIAEP